MMPEDEETKQRYNMQWQGFVIVKDGDCTWEEKARNAQAMGAQALLIVQSNLKQIEERIWHDSWSKYDGSGSSIQIPTLIL